MAGTVADALTALVVDDEAPALAEMRFLLEQDERIGRIITASSGTDALRALESEPIDVVFSDINMPGMNGWELAKFWKNRFSDRNLINKKEETVSRVRDLFVQASGQGKRIIANLFSSRGFDYSKALCDEFTLRQVAGTYYEIDVVEKE